MGFHHPASPPLVSFQSVLRRRAVKPGCSTSFLKLCLSATVEMVRNCPTHTNRCYYAGLDCQTGRKDRLPMKSADVHSRDATEMVWDLHFSPVTPSRAWSALPIQQTPFATKAA